MSHSVTGILNHFTLTLGSATSCLNYEHEATDSDIHDTETLETQTRSLDPELFSEPSLVLSPRRRPYQGSANLGTVRIHARCFNLSDSSSLEGDIQPSVVTLERAALCQIFLETKYHKAFHQPSERDLRRQALEALVCNGKELTLGQRAKFNEVMKSLESEWSRLSRIRPSIQAFTIERKLGSGGFGVVTMVTENHTGKIYAMKVCAYT